MYFGWARTFTTIVAIGGLAASGAAAALGFGPIRSSVVLGQPLNLAVPISLSEGETLGSECASAEVVSGDNKLAPGAVRVRVTQGRDAGESVLRITTTSVVDEPILTVTVNAGCPTRLSRTLTLLADPPLVTTAATPAPTQSLPTVAQPSAAPATAAAPSAVNPAPRATRPAPPTRATRLANARPAPRASVAAAPRAAPAASEAAAAPKAPLRMMGKAAGRPRLQLDGGQVSVTQASVLAAEEQASAARATANAAEAAASAAGERMRAMEADMARMRADAKAQTEALLQLRQQLALDRAQREQPTPLTMGLLGLAALLAALAAWLGWRLRAKSQSVHATPAQADWWERSRMSEQPSETPSTASGFLASEVAPLPRAPSTLQAPLPQSEDSRHSEFDSRIAPPTLPAPTAVTIPAMSAVASTAALDEASRAMSVDEQIDLEQQADFFIALGHDDAAIDLLMAHMRSTGGGSPLPFLKLLEIHRRRDQREAYERTRVRFNQRFNSVAPDWQADPKAGRTLEEYSLAMGRIQRAWPSPLDAMAELEALLFRRGPGAELFDLPAYQELLFLYQMARDLHQADDTGATDVDVLLPIGGRSAPVAAAAGTIMLRPEFNDGEPLALDLDLDLTTDHGGMPAEPLAVTEAPVALTIEPIEKAVPDEPEEDFWASNPDARPTR